MQLPAVLVKIGIGVSLLAIASTHALAGDQSNDSLLCAVYMDIAVNDLYPLGAIPHSKAKEMLVGRFTRLAAVNLVTQEPISDVVSDFIAVRSKTRQELAINSGLNSMRLYSSDQVFKYAKNLDAKTTEHCTPSNEVLKALMVSHSKEVITSKFVEASKELEKQEKK